MKAEARIFDLLLHLSAVPLQVRGHYNKQSKSGARVSLVGRDEGTLGKAVVLRAFLSYEHSSVSFTDTDGQTEHVRSEVPLQCDASQNPVGLVDNHDRYSLLGNRLPVQFKLTLVGLREICNSSGCNGAYTQPHP